MHSHVWLFLFSPAHYIIWPSLHFKLICIIYRVWRQIKYTKILWKEEHTYDTSQFSLVYKPFLLFNLFLTVMSETSVLHLQTFRLLFSQLPLHRKDQTWAQCSNRNYMTTAGIPLCTTCSLYFFPLYQSRKQIILPQHKTVRSQHSTTAFSFFSGNILPYSLLSLFVQLPVDRSFNIYSFEIPPLDTFLQFVKTILSPILIQSKYRSFHVGELWKIKHVTSAVALLNLSTKNNL